MKVIQVFNRYLKFGGEENSVERIACHLEAGGHEVKRFWTSSESWKGAKAPSRWRQAFLIGNNKEVLKELQCLHQEFSPHIWILHNVIPVVSVGVYKLARELDVPIVQWLHNYRPMTVSGLNPDTINFTYLNECLEGKWRGSRVQTIILALHYLKARYRGDFESVKLAVSVSQSMEQCFEKGGWFTKELATLHHSWDTKDVLLKRNRGKYFLFLGRIVEEKGIRFLVKLFSLPEMAKFKLFVAGSGELESELKKMSTSNIHWIGFVSGKEKEQLIRDCTAVLFPSQWEEPLSTIAYEAYEQKRCVITSDRGGMPEIVFHGLTGYVLPAAEIQSWVEVITNHSESHFDDLGNNGRQWLVDNVNAQKWNENFLGILSQKLLVK